MAFVFNRAYEKATCVLKEDSFQHGCLDPHRMSGEKAKDKREK